MANYPQAHAADEHSSYDFNTLVYRLYSGQFYGLSGGTKTYEKAHTNDVIKFIFDPKNKRLLMNNIAHDAYMITNPIR